MEELKSSPDTAEGSRAPDLAIQELDQDLNGTAAQSSQVNDLTWMVVEKK